MTTLASFYALAAAAPAGDRRRYALGAAYQIQERVGWGESIASARARVMSLPQYSTALVAAGLDDDLALVDSVSGAAFAPTDLGVSLLAWWKADALGLSNGAAVTSWADTSANGRTLSQATGANQPVFTTAAKNGLPAVTFDGANDYMATAAFASPTSGVSVFAVVNLTSVNIFRTILCHAAAATWTAPYARVLLRAGDASASSRWQWIVEDAGVGANQVQSAAGATAATWLLVEGHYDQANQDIFEAGVSVGTQARTGALTSSTQPVFIGADTSLADNFPGQIGELLYCSSLNATQRGQVRSYLQGRWAL